LIDNFNTGISIEIDQTVEESYDLLGIEVKCQVHHDDVPVKYEGKDVKQSEYFGCFRP